MKKLALLLTAIASLTIASMAHAQDPHLKAFDKVSTDGSQHFYHAVSSKPLSLKTCLLICSSSTVQTSSGK
jgi:hypothetical protein